MANPKVTAEKRKVLGRKVKKLRQEGLLPATVYGKDVKSQSLTVDLKEFEKIYTETGETGLIDLMIKGEKKVRPVLVHNLQVHPVEENPLHIEFHQVDLTKKVSVNIPIEITGKAPAVEKGGVLFALMDEVEIEALPADLPEKFEVDVSLLKEIGQTVLLKDLKYDSKKIKILVENLEVPVAKVEEPKEEEEPEPTPEAVEGEAETVEGEAEAVEGEKAEEKPGEKKEGEGEKKIEKGAQKTGDPKEKTQPAKEGKPQDTKSKAK